MRPVLTQGSSDYAVYKGPMDVPSLQQRPPTSTLPHPPDVRQTPEGIRTQRH